jgi:hypothetical protein
LMSKCAQCTAPGNQEIPELKESAKAGKHQEISDAGEWQH